MKKSQGIKNNWLIACIAGLLAAGVCVLLTLPAAKLMETGVLPVKWSSAVAYSILGMSSAASALFAALKGKRRVLLLCLTESTVLFLAMIVMNGVLQKGQFERIWQTAVTVFGVSAIIGIVCAGKKRRY